MPLCQEAFIKLAQHGDPSVRSAAAASLPHLAVAVTEWPDGPQFLADRCEVGHHANHEYPVIALPVTSVLIVAICASGAVRRRQEYACVYCLAAQAFCADEAPIVREAALADVVLLVASVGASQRSAVLAAAVDALPSQSSAGSRLWRGRLAFAEQAGRLAALCAPQAWQFDSHDGVRFA